MHQTGQLGEIKLAELVGDLSLIQPEGVYDMLRFDPMNQIQSDTIRFSKQAMKILAVHRTQVHGLHVESLVSPYAGSEPFGLLIMMMEAEVDVLETIRYGFEEFHAVFCIELVLANHSEVSREVRLKKVGYPQFFLAGQWEDRLVIPVDQSSPTREACVQVPGHEKHLAVGTFNDTVVPFS